MEDSLQKGIQNYECKIRYNREYLNKKKAKTNNWSFGDLGPFFSEIRNASIEMLPEYSPSLHGTFYSSQQLLAYTGPMHVRGPEAASFTAFASREALTPLLPGSLLNFSKLFQKCQNLRPKEDGPFTYRTKKGGGDEGSVKETKVFIRSSLFERWATSNPGLDPTSVPK